MKTSFCSVIALVLSLLPWFAAGSPGQSAPGFTTLHSFNFGGDGSGQGTGASGLSQGQDGNLYGTTDAGGTGGPRAGTVFKITPAGSLTTLHPFNGTDGYAPNGVVPGGDGNFYGTTTGGFTFADAHGSVFAMTPTGVLTTLHRFSAPGSDGSNGDGAAPVAGLVPGGDGNLYGTAAMGGIHADGTVFKITPGGTLTTLHHFDGVAGSHPRAALVQGADGSFYGTTYDGGAKGQGTVFKIAPGGAFTSLHSFSGGDGSFPQGSLAVGRDGNFYGTTTGDNEEAVNQSGNVFRMTPDGTLTSVHHFNSGESPGAGLVPGADGNFYGVTPGAGGNSYGEVFRVTPAGAVTVLHSFDGNDGLYPMAALFRASDGNFYGTTEQGSGSNEGTIFKVIVAPLITSATSAAATEGKAFSYRIRATNEPTSYGVAGLPKGLSVDGQTGVVSGTPEVSGVRTLTLKAANRFGTGSATLTLAIRGRPVITSAKTATATVGRASGYQITATENPTSFGVLGLPPGFHVDAKTGLISGTPTKAGSFTLTIKASNVVGTGKQTLTLTVKGG